MLFFGPNIIRRLSKKNLQWRNFRWVKNKANQGRVEEAAKQQVRLRREEEDGAWWQPLSFGWRRVMWRHHSRLIPSEMKIPRLLLFVSASSLSLPLPLIWFWISHRKVSLAVSLSEITRYDLSFWFFRSVNWFIPSSFTVSDPRNETLVVLSWLRFWWKINSPVLLVDVSNVHVWWFVCCVQDLHYPWFSECREIWL